MPMIRSEFNLNFTQAGVLLSLFAIIGGFSQLPSGWLADRIGTRTVVALGISGVALAGLFFGLSQTFFMLIVFLVAMAVLTGGYHPAAASAISLSVKPENLGRALGLHLTGGSASHFVAPLLAAAIALIWGWRGAYITLAIPTFILGIALYVLLGRYQTAMSTAEKVMTADGTGPPSSRERHLPQLIAFLAMSLSVGALTHAARGFIPMYVVAEFNVSEETAGTLMSLITVAGFWAAPLGGYLSDRIGRIPVLIMVSLLSGPIIYLLTVVPYGLPFWVMLVIMGTLGFTRMPASEAFIVSHTSERRRATVFGIYYFTSREIGGVLSPVMGNLIDRFGFRSSFSIVGATTVAVTLLCSVFLWGNRDKSSRN